MLDNLEKNCMFVLPYALLFKKSQDKKIIVVMK